MIVRAISRGQSFKKLAAYLTSPKEGQHRALWSEAENLAADDPKLAAKIMAHTAMNADALKEAAGIGGGGRKTKHGPVYHALLSWAEGQTPTRDEQLAAARDMLKAIGLENAQALIVAHNDNGKEHVHLMVNLVDPETGRRFTLSNDQHRMQAWALDYERRHGATVATAAREARADKWAQGGQTAKAERLSRPAYNRADRAAREGVFTRQATERAGLYKAHSAEWREAKAEAAAMRGAYKAAFRSALAIAKQGDKAENKPKWRALFRRHDAERAQTAQRADYARQQAAAARKEAQAAAKAAPKAQRRAATILGGLAQRLGLLSTPEAAEGRVTRAAEAMVRAAAELAAAELARAGMKAKQEAERAALAKALGEVTFAKAKLAVDEMPRSDFAAMIEQQAVEKARLIEAHNAERDAHGMTRYEPKTSRKDEPMQQDRKPLTTREASAAFDAKRQAHQPQSIEAEGAKRVHAPAFQHGKGAVGAPPRQKVEATAEQASRNRFGAAELGASPLKAAREKLNTPEAKAARAAKKPPTRTNRRDDFER